MYRGLYILFFFVESSRATSRGLAGHFWPVGHRLGTPWSKWKRD